MPRKKKAASKMPREEEESRTAALGRKRKQRGPKDLNDYSQPTGKRARHNSYGTLGDIDADGSRRGSRESGEISTSASGEDHRATSSRTQVEAVDPRVSPISDVNELAAPRRETLNRGEMRLEHIENDAFRQHINAEIKSQPGATVESLVRQCLEEGKPFRKHAGKLVTSWDARMPVGRANLANGMALEQIGLRYRARQFTRQMTTGDLVNFPTLALNMRGLGVDGPRDDSLFETLMRIAQHKQPFHKQARQALQEFAANTLLSGSPKNSVGDRHRPDPQHSHSHVSDAPSVGGSPRQAPGEDYLAESSDDMSLSDGASDGEASEGSGDEAATRRPTNGHGNDYGNLARTAATAGNDNMTQEHHVRLQEISNEDQLLQYRYYKLTDPMAYVRCLSCGVQGHMQDDCAENTCKHCGAHDDHFSDACPTFRKCRLCRQRGHDEPRCNKRGAEAGGMNDPCDICARTGHVEEECAGLWRSFSIKDEEIIKVPANQMAAFCYNCGNSGHWGDDCQDLPSYLRSGINRTWSAENANRFLVGREKAPAHGYANSYSYQMAQFDDMRD